MWYSVQCSINTFKIADAYGKAFKPFMPPPCWKCPKRFKLGLGESWKSECSSDSDVDEVASRKKLSPHQSPPLLVINPIIELHKGIQEQR